MPDPKKKKLCPRCAKEYDEGAETCPNEECKAPFAKAKALADLFKLGIQLNQEGKPKKKTGGILDELDDLFQ